MDATPGPAPALPPAGGGTGGTGGNGGTGSAGGPGGPGAGGGTARRPLHRSSTERWFAGVAGGLAEHFAIDPLIVRAIFVVLTLTGGLGVALYIAGWLLMPDPASGRAVGEDLVEKARHSPSWVPVVLIGIGILIAIGPVADVGGPFVWGALLIGAGIWMYRRADAAPPPPPAQPPTETQPPAGSRPAGSPPPAASRPAVDIISSEFQTAAHTASTQLRSYEARTAAPRPPRPRSHLGRLTVAAALVALGVVAMLHNAGAVTVAPRHYPAIALLIVGTGLLAGSVWGRSRGLIFLGLLVVPVALLATFLDVPFEGGVGYRSFTPATPADAADGYHLFAGRMQVDLTEMDWSEPVTLDATVAFGVIEVAVPRDVDVRVTSHAGAGRIVLFGQERVGTALDFDLAEPAAPGPGGGGTLDLDAEASFGQVLVHRAGEPADPTDTDEGYFGPLPTGPAIPSPTAVPSPPVAPSPPPAPSPPAAPAPGVDQRTLDELFPIGVRP